MNSSIDHKSKVVLIRLLLLTQPMMLHFRAIQFATNQIPNTSTNTPKTAWVMTITAEVERSTNSPLKLRKDGSITVTMEAVFKITAIPIRLPCILNLRFRLTRKIPATKRARMEI